MRLRFLLLLLNILVLSGLDAQHQDLQEKPKIWNGEQPAGKDSLSLLSAFRSGRVNGHFRYFYSATDNKDNLTDYHAHAAGGGLRFETAEFHRFRFAVSGFYIFNLGASDFTQKDPITNAPNRYEIGLFDIANPGYRDEISRLEEFYLRYRIGKQNSLTFGKLLINTPFINLQDGRMRPTQVQGFWSEWHDLPNLDIYAGWIYSIAPRGTSRWYRLDESIGVYPVGFNPDGSRSGYKSNLESAGAALLGAKYNVSDNISIQAWNLYTENIFNSLLLQSDGSFKLTDKYQLVAGIQSIIQTKIGNGGNDDINKSFYNNENGAVTFGARIGLKQSANEFSLNFNRITNDGRYLMPREWGRDPFYTFLPRERNEGFGDVTAIMAQYKWAKRKSPFQFVLAAGYYVMPDVKNTRLNKFAVPSYAQANVDIRYRFSGYLEGLEGQLLVVRKFSAGEDYANPVYIFNKVDMTLINVVMNYRF